MSTVNQLLEPPSYGFLRDGKFYKPTQKEIVSEFFSRLNIFTTKKNWLPFTSWLAVVGLLVPLAVFLTHYFSIKLLFVGLTYAMVCLGTHGTIYLHRYSTHRAYKFSNSFALFICRNLSIKVLAEEVYVISHHVHHHLSEQPGDPYNVNGGFLYCFLADVNHQGVAQNMNPEEYSRLTKLLNHTGVKANSYKQYQKWGSIAHPVRTYINYILNWSFWYGLFFLIGGHALATAIFGMSAVWAVGVRTFNYDGHGRGVDRRVDGIDFNREDLSVNQTWPGYVSGEWHNNHHLYPSGARAGFLPYQLDLAWLFIRFYTFIGGISSHKDFKKEFMRDHYLPYLRKNGIPVQKKFQQWAPEPTL